ncbi:uncharacterized protein [Canis lupus baileyi]|uniref:uncharacterized protein isoform X1 n=1 Tax=Canis lupus baileyi TaxID=143281 RepID=UPI003B97C83A
MEAQGPAAPYSLGFAWGADGGSRAQSWARTSRICTCSSSSALCCGAARTWSCRAASASARWSTSSRIALQAARRAVSLRRWCAWWRQNSSTRQPPATAKTVASPSSSAPSSAAASSFSGFTAAALKPMRRILARISTQWYTAGKRGHEGSICKPGNRTSLGSESSNTLILDFPASRTFSSTCCFHFCTEASIPPKKWDICWAQREKGCDRPCQEPKSGHLGGSVVEHLPLAWRCCYTWDKFIVIPMDPQKSEAEDCRTYIQKILGALHSTERHMLPVSTLSCDPASRWVTLDKCPALSGPSLPVTR